MDKPTIYDYLLLQSRPDDLPELAQAKTRVILTAMTWLGMLIARFGFGFQGEIIDLMIWVLLPGYLLLSYINTLHILSHPELRSWRLNLSLIGDCAMVSFGFYAMGINGVVWYPIYVWVMIGNGFRFGVQRLHVAMLATTVGFLVASIANGLWQTHLPIAMGLFVGILILPIFFSTILQRLNAANEELKRRIDESEYQATHDQLTRLPNRLLLEDRLGHALSRANRAHKNLAVLFIDVDNFKSINDNFGHSVGDTLLTQYAERMSRSLREGDTLVRLGGDEFIIVLEDITESVQAAQFAERLLEQITDYYHVNGYEFFVTASVGIAYYPDDGEDIDSLMRNADTAMYKAKEQAGKSYQIYSREMSQNVAERLSLSLDLRKALEGDQFQLYYMPIVDTESGVVKAAEALLRWHSPERGLVAPAGFLDVLESSELIFPVGLWVMETACLQRQQWVEAGFDAMGISVNVSPRQFRDPAFPEKVQEIIQNTGIPPTALRLEITESVLIESVELVEQHILTLKEVGVGILLDDFGTGYSSIGSLKHLSIDALKIDKSFLDGVPDNADSCALINSAIAIGNNLRMYVVAEGVEEERQLEWLKQSGCEYSQGYFHKRPVPAPEFIEYLRDQE